MKEILAFLSELHRNNNREWFEANRERYREARARFDDFTMRLTDALSTFDPRVRGLSLRDCSFRTYRDIRFHRDQGPYHTHMAAFVCPRGRNSGYMGYYVRVQPEAEVPFPAQGHLLSVGMYRPEPAVMKCIREEIRDCGEEFARALGEAEGFSPDKRRILARMPAGFDADDPHAAYLRMREIDLLKPLDRDFLLRDNLVGRLAGQFRRTYALTGFVNRCVDYAREV